MRSATLGFQARPDPRTVPTDVSLQMFRRMCLIRYFDLRQIKAVEEGHVTCLTYLSLGQEAVAAAVATAVRETYVLTQHRGIGPYLAYGGNIEALIDELLGLPSGCCRGMGGSVCIHDPAIKMIGHEGLIGHHVPIAVGLALGSGMTTTCFFGDGAAEEDYFFPPLGFAVTRRLPVLFVCEDNDLSVLTPTQDRRAWNVADVARAFGLNAVDITDDPWLVYRWTCTFAGTLPAFLNVRTVRHRWHVGIGVDGPAEWNRFELVKQELRQLGLGTESEAIETEVERFVEAKWQERLLIRSGK